MKILAIMLSFLFGGFFGVTTMCLAQASGAASRAEEKELERLEEERKRQSNT